MIDSIFSELIKVNAGMHEQIYRRKVVVVLTMKKLKLFSKNFHNGSRIVVETSMLRELVRGASTYLRLNLKLNCQVQWGVGYSPFSLLRVIPN